MKIMSFNLLCGGDNGRDWRCRKEMVLDTIRRADPDTLGAQEAHYDWIQTLTAGLPDYDYVGVGREDGKTDGEFSAVFYKKDRFRLLDSGSFWLSETPEVPGVKGWDAACVRICSWAKLEEKATGKRFVHFNTHLDHVGPVAMQKGAELVTAKAAEICPDLPAFFTGDFNVTPASAPYKTVIAAGFTDARHAAKVSDDSVTFHMDVFVNDPPKPQNAVIDYCFFKGDVTVDTFRVITDVYPGGLYPSDHFPVLAEVDF
ncbi:MAG: endonuclease/exonuclease/phosphatase family protein [Clostridia bacterium]|nr:endonuclease/exonuclease/phosphatase family protein [Clostridia bacterium]MBR0536986.1 endonuclease/exonuclease/phosphatase family protein [Clostridia bacterium]